MSRDLLNEATRALRETEDVSEFEAHATRARVMGGLHQTRVRKRTRLAFLLPIAATFLAASAWGAASGQAQRALQRVEQLIGLAASAPKTETHLAPAVAPKPLVVDTVSPPALLAPTPDRQLASSAAQPSAAHAVPSGSALAGPAVDPALSLYRAAHTAHFVDHDPARALAAWDAYLAAAPTGSFAPEAQYNRALSLVRLGRTAEARSALSPFASGAYGAYRQAEASALLERLTP